MLKFADPADFAWLRHSNLQRLLATLSADNNEARVVGGAVRNSLLKLSIGDIDIATTTTPDQTINLAQNAGFRCVATGLAYGTVTVIVDSQPFEVTTLRSDIGSDGRRAVVQFSRDWQTDAKRRDFTMNALYLDAEGTIYDFVDGLVDIDERRVRFIGEPEQRISEDYLRILRFFRFFAWYGSGRPDADGLKAVTRLKDGLEKLSVERIFQELYKLLSASDPIRALLWMRQTGVLGKVLPEGERWGIDNVQPLVTSEKTYSWPIDPILRLESMLPPDSERLSQLAMRLKLSKAIGSRLARWAQCSTLKLESSQNVREAVVKWGAQPITDRLKLALATASNSSTPHNQPSNDTYLRWLEIVANWQTPNFPVSGRDLIALGYPSGKKMGEILHHLKDYWINNDFQPGKEALLHYLKSGGFN